MTETSKVDMIMDLMEVEETLVHDNELEQPNQMNLKMKIEEMNDMEKV